MADQLPPFDCMSLRHTVATLAYRGAKAIRGVPSEFGSFQVAPGSRTAGQILAHIGDLMDWALALTDGRRQWHDSQPLPWEEETRRFFLAIARLDARLTSGAPLQVNPEKLFQGPIADALTHFGQICLLRRLALSPVRGENYYRAEIVTGRVGEEQAAPGLEFD